MPSPRRARPRWTAAVTVVLAVVLAAAGAACTSAAPPADIATVGPDAPTGQWRWTPQADRLQLGVTHTRRSLDPDEPDAARHRGVAILGDHGAVWQNHHLMGFGTLNPEPAPGAYDWESLDRRMRLTDETGGRVTLTLCCAPDWMKGGAPGTTDWTRLEDDPLPEHFADFAALAAAAVQRYPQVERVLVWNELKGFYRTDLNRWDQEGYTALYNAVYRAVKAVRPDVAGRRPVRRARQPRPGPAGRVGPARAVGHDRPPGARRRRLLAHAQGRRRLRGRRRQHQDPGRHPPAHTGRRRPEVRGRRPVAARPHGPADLVGRVLRGRPRRGPGRPGEPGQCRGHPRRRRGVRGDGGAGGAAVGPAGRRAPVRRAVDRQHHARRRAARRR